MTTTTEFKMEDRIVSKDWSFVETMKQGSESYEAFVGVLRTMFKFSDMPLTINMLIADKNSEVWIETIPNNWQRVY